MQPMCILLQGLLCGWWMEKAPRRDGLRCSWMGSGAASVMMAGQTEMPQWFAGNWDSGESSRTGILQIETALRGYQFFLDLFLGASFLSFGIPTYAWGTRDLFSLYYCLCVEWHINTISLKMCWCQVGLPPAYCRLAIFSLIAVVQQKPGQWLILVKAMGPSIWTM